MSAKFPVLLAAATLAMLSLTATGAAAEQSPVPSADSTSASQPEHTPARRPDVTITGQRPELEAVSAFVNLIAGSYFQGEALARWQVPVCPLVSGLPSQEGEFILARVSDIARSAGIELARENCRPNVYILMTTQPKELLTGMDKRNQPFTFGEAAPAVIEEFVSTPRPVRVWYHTAAKTPEGSPLLHMSYPDYALMRSRV